MFWDTVSPVYDFFEVIYNSRVYRNTGKAVANDIPHPTLYWSALAEPGRSVSISHQNASS